MVTILERYEQTHAGSAAMHAEAAKVFPSGVTHDIRHFTPFPICVQRARGSRKWDVDGNEIIDYVMGHGALLLGHLHPAVEAAVEQQIHLGTHLGASHPYELAWGRLVQQLVPSAEKVRFTSSGTEATQMAVRLARFRTGRSRVIRFAGHFHGWSDTLIEARGGSAEDPSAPGIPGVALRQQLSLPQNDIDALANALAEHGSDVAAVILEPTGAAWGDNPIDLSFVQAVRELTAKAGVILIFDEVITGFRASKGGAQARYGILPDLTTMAKIVAGGLPGGCVAGRADLLDQIAFTDDPEHDSKGRISHPGTFNANPLSAVAAAACLSEVAKGEPNKAADAAALRLASGMNEIVAKRGVQGCVYGYASMLHILLGQPARLPDDGITYVWQSQDHRRAPHTAHEIEFALRRAMLNEGVDLMHAGMMVSAVHDDRDVDATIEAFDRSLAALQAEGVV
ncbi:MAG TPA: aspartate aminotransferase family protein [Dehalococcoidia bacterium]|nr:aspartate aminotransferase family protein [Dehalococcoidia bacterium]